jgi:hypothetical protein
LCIGCSDDSSGGKDAAATDAKAGVDARTGDSKAGGDSKAAGDSSATACNQPGDSCPSGLTCLCCGAIGPSSICLCTKACKGDGDCDADGLPFCNMRSGGTSGICTPTGFNCCWDCQ